MNPDIVCVVTLKFRDTKARVLPIHSCPVHLFLLAVYINTRQIGWGVGKERFQVLKRFRGSGPHKITWGC